MNRVVIVTGGSSGIGKSLSEYFKSCNDKVYILANDIETDPKNHMFFCDVSSISSINTVANEIKNIETGIDIIINCAGYGLSGITELLSSQDIEKQFSVNVFGTININNAFLPIIKSGGKIINISSAMAYLPLPYRTMYASSKSAITTYSYGLYMELRHHNIHVCAIAPGDIKTNFTKNRVKDFKTNERYGNSMQNITTKLDTHQEKRMSILYVTNKIINIIEKKYKKPLVIVGKKYKVLYFAQKFLPKKFILKIIEKHYSGNY